MESKLAPGFLVASPHMQDPFFEKTVVFLIEHDNEEGSFGIIVNQASNLEMMDLFEELGFSERDDFSPRANPPVLAGGPVTPELGWVIHSTDWVSTTTQTYEDKICVTASIEILEAIAIGDGPSRFLFCLGYSGWAKDQLVEEIKTGAWLNVPFDASLFFDVPMEDRWAEAIRRLGVEPASIVPHVGGA